MCTSGCGINLEIIVFLWNASSTGACPNQPWGYCRENEEEGGSSVDYMEVEEEQDGRHDTVLHVAMRHNLPAAAAALLDSGADAVCINQRGESPLHLACQHGTACPLVQQMVRHGGICQQRDASGLTPLQHFVSSFISSSGEGRDLKQVTFTLTYLLDAGYTLDAEVWLRNLRQIRSNSNIPLQTWSLNFIYRALISNLGEDTLQMLLDWSYHVKSLSTLSRIAVRRTLGAVMVRKKIEALPLPHAIKMSLWTIHCIPEVNSLVKNLQTPQPRHQWYAPTKRSVWSNSVSISSSVMLLSVSPACNSCSMNQCILYNYTLWACFLSKLVIHC